ncbi:MAG: polysaccharide biosynthesis C-terminal domain-containing protein [Flavobacteriaceae bacterium]|nr:polysaccharide biosynthesis C-terminal domain-containing protein [Mangrovimonas sp.]MCB0432749.1 polysaccharide biosynthesis C-terminal domain-containing protein [Mangrovimonas sp.]MCB0438162.1 polysaccharide biosynthesis C-terminal domain-containing protein [Mangrovimonas sp.]MCB0470050.1 polysaccharide biosynthesis C-terminal domain-containing protein [Flavobacteriaceae bacterium]
MGIVLKQSFKNTLVTYIGFGIGAVNVLFLFTNFLSEDYVGLITFILSTANILMPLMAFGTHNTIVKFYSSYKTKQSQNSFLMLMVFLPLVVIIPFGLIGVFAYKSIGEWLSSENDLILDYVWLIYVAAIAFAYFEVFYAWAKVQMKTVFGNFMREVFHRLGTTLLLICFYYKLITVEQLIYGVTGVYILRMLVMKLYAYSLKAPTFRIYKIGNLSNVLKYTTLIIIAGSIANIILEIDKFMIGHYVPIENVAYYGVAIYISMVINVPYRSLHQIASPITAKLLNEKNKVELSVFYRKSSINLFVISGLIFLLIVLNINEMYRLIPENYSEGLLVVFLISFAKLLDSLLGNNNAILFNSDHYRVVLAQGVFLAVITIGMNMLLIPEYGINGAAIASFLCMLVYNTIKVTYVYRKFKMQPFTVDTVKTFVLILVSLGIFYYWDFSFHPFINIVLKSALISVFYVIMSYYLDLSEDINKLINKYLLRR